MRRCPAGTRRLGGLLIEIGDLEGVYTHSFEVYALDRSHRQLPAPEPISVAALQTWLAAQDEAMKAALERFTEEELQVDRIDRGGGFIASPFVQFQVYRDRWVAGWKAPMNAFAITFDGGLERAAN